MAGRSGTSTWILWLISIGITFFIIEVISYLAGSHLVDPQTLFYEKESIARTLQDEPLAEFEQQRATRIHEVLGWPNPEQLRNRRNHRFDRIGARKSPAYPQVENACVSLYGDSFTYSDEVEHEDAWGNQLAELMQCRVNNLGVYGYGTDQAYLRFLHETETTGNDQAGIVLLNHMTGDILRNLNQWRVFAFTPHRSSEWRNIKPTVVERDGNLQAVPPPSIPYSNIDALLDRPSSYLPDDFFAPGNGGGLVQWGFPFSLNLVRALLAKYYRDGTENSLSHFYNPGHPSGAYRKTVAILNAFHDKTGNAGKLGVVVFIPHKTEIYDYRKTGQWYSEPMQDELRRGGVHVFNFGERLIENGQNADSCDFFIRPRCGGHFNARGYRLLAEYVNELLVEHWPDRASARPLNAPRNPYY